MNILLAQLILAGQGGDDAKGWMNILFVVVLAVFWIISGIVKATSKKPQERQKQQPPVRKPIHKVPSPATVSGLSSARSKKTTQARPQPRSRPAMLASKVEKALRSKTIEATQKLESLPPKRQAEPIIQDIPEYTSKPLIEPDHMRLGIPQKATKEEDLPEIVLDYSDPEELTKAILHYEILGPPVSLRSPSHQSLDF